MAPLHLHPSPPTSEASFLVLLNQPAFVHITRATSTRSRLKLSRPPPLSSGARFLSFTTSAASPSSRSSLPFCVVDLHHGLVVSQAFRRHYKDDFASSTTHLKHTTPQSSLRTGHEPGRKRRRGRRRGYSAQREAGEGGGRMNNFMCAQFHIPKQIKLVSTPLSNFNSV